MIIKNLWREEFISGYNSFFTLSSLGKSGQEVNRARGWNREQMQRPWRSAVYWLVHYSSLSLFLRASGTSNIGLALPTVSWVLICQSSIKKMHDRPASRLIWCNHFLNESLLFPNDSGLWQVKKKLKLSRTLSFCGEGDSPYPTWISEIII